MVMDYIYSGLSGPIGGIGNFCPPSPNNLLGVDMRVWNAMDCYAGRIIGFGPRYSFNSSIMGIMTAVALTGGAGLAAFFLGMISCIMFIFFIYRSIFYILGAYLTVAMMMVLAPLLFPMIVFKSTFKYFKAWLDMLFSGILTPMFIIAFLIFFISLVDTVMFKGMRYGSTIYITMDAVFNTVPGQDPADNIYKIREENKTVFSVKVISDPEQTSSRGGWWIQRVWNYVKEKGTEYANNWINGVAHDVVEGAGLGTYTTLDFSKLDPANAQPGETEKRLRSLTYIMVALFLVCAAGISLISTIPGMVSDMTSGGAEIMAMGVRGMFEPR